MTATVYSAIYGDYDEPKPLPAGRDFAAIMYTDSQDTAWKASELGWVVRIVPHGVATCNGDPAKVAPMLAHKHWKTHPGQVVRLGEIALWVDGSITITRPDYGAACVAALGNDDIALTPHPWRDCAIAEGEYSATLARYASTPVGEQTRFYAGFHPRGWGLFATGAIAWRTTPDVIAFSRHWWHECLNWSHQDQVSLPVLLRMEQEVGLEGVERLRWNNNLRWEQWWTLSHHAVAP